MSQNALFLFWISAGIFEKDLQGILIIFVSVALKGHRGFFTPLSHQVHEPEAEFFKTTIRANYFAFEASNKSIWLRRSFSVSGEYWDTLCIKTLARLRFQA